MAQIPKQLALLSGIGLLLNFLLLVFAFRSIGEAFLACLPGALGLLGTLAILSLLHIPLNLVSASALVLILGCGVDYGIFAVQGMAHAARNTRCRVHRCPAHLEHGAGRHRHALARLLPGDPVAGGGGGTGHRASAHSSRCSSCPISGCGTRAQGGGNRMSRRDLEAS